MYRPDALIKPVTSMLAAALLTVAGATFGSTYNLSDSPLFITANVPPLTLLVMGRDHKLYYEAYNDASDLNADGVIDTRYKPAIDYFGYFDSNKCYTYDGTNARFNPAAAATSKTCSNQWSGDFLNYLTTSRMDALRKVFYGGNRSTDTATETVLQRAYIPQDAHSWGKEYTSVAIDGYDISDYAPMSLPATNTRHLFANTTLSDNGDPLLRVLTNTPFRIWEWVSIERPVAGTDCATGNNVRTPCIGTGSDTWQIVPSSAFSGLTQTTYDISGAYIPNDHTGYEDLVSDYAISSNEFGSGTASEIDGAGNPYGSDEYYLTIFSGTLTIPTDGDYTFAVDGDDALELFIDGTLVASWYGGHADCNCQTHSGTINLSAGDHSIEYRHQEWTGGDNYYLYWELNAASSAMTDYQVRAKVCQAGLLEANCQIYPDGNYKPVGLLQQYGENDAMKFGLLSGSYKHNTAGGVLRKNIGSITDEIDANTGQFSATAGIIKTIDSLRIVNFDYSDHAYDCGWITTRSITDEECPMWGNPIGEMMYEGLRYFAGKATPTSAFSISSTDTPDATLGLPVATWTDPYALASGNARCAKPFQIVISDINPSYDSDQVPGSYFNSFTGDITGLDCQAEADDITANETDVPGLHFIGQSAATYDGAPSPKTVTSLGDIRGLSPEEPTKSGSYYAASIAYFGHTNDLNPVAGEQKMDTFSVALASPLPRIEIPINNQTVTLVPYAKSVGGSSIDATQGLFQPTNQIVDFYPESITPTSGSFRINFEDVEQGADHDMDAIARYQYTVNLDGTVTVTMASDYAAGGIIQHMGYVISGTTEDGTYLEVRDSDTGSGSDIDYFLDTPNTIDDLPLTASRTFTPSGTSGATLMKDPLWYAAKWGGFIDAKDANGASDGLPTGAEWDADGDNQPDNYYLVTNALTLKDQLSRAFDEVLERTGSASTVALTSGSITGSTKAYQARFKSKTWTGQLLAFPINSDGTVGTQVWDSGDAITAQSANTRAIISYKPSSGSGIPFRWPIDPVNPTSSELDTAQTAALNLNPDSGNADGLGSERLDYLRGTDVTGFRSRVSKLGDIVHSAPAFVGAPRGRYPNDWDDLTTTGNDTAAEDAVPYRTWRNATARSQRQQVVYFGANDGMLHGVDAGSYNSGTGSFSNGTGAEVLGYVPSPVFANLNQLTSPNYTHRYYVDAAVTFTDAFFASDWHTVLTGGLGAGGQGIFALDITNPASFNENSADALSLWEFTDAYAGDTDNDTIPDGIDLGYMLNQPVSIVRMHNGVWAAVFGNGYNSNESDGHTSTTGNAILFIVNIETGNLIRKIDTKIGMADDPLSSGRPNGMSAPAPIDADGDFIADYIYAGDLFGNLWKFDVRDTNPTNWKSAYGITTSPQPLFIATAADGITRQPITTRPQIGLHPTTADSYMVYFGTGKYFEVADNIATGQTTQSFYGIWDQNQTSATTPVSRSNLLQQQIVKEVTQNFTSGTFDLRVISDNTICWISGTNCTSPKKGWYLDLIPPTGGNQGERQVSDAILHNERIIFTTLIPSSDPCSGGGTGWLMELDAINGGRFSFAPFDLNGDGAFDDQDYADTGVTDANGNVVYVPPGGKKSKVGIIQTPSILSTPSAQGGGKEYKYTSGTQNGDIEKTVENPGPGAVGRQTWRQLF